MHNKYFIYMWLYDNQIIMIPLEDTKGSGVWNTIL
jgi:hypothetical protein